LDVIIGDNTKGINTLTIVAKNERIKHKMFVIKLSVELKSGFTETVDYLVKVKGGS